jgi:S1-C subfamily serine protease
MKRVFLALSVLMIAVLACNQGISFSPTQPAQEAPSAIHVQTNPPLQVAASDPAQQQDALVALYQAVLPGVVTIRTDTGLGSGFVFDAEGHIVTNQHVVDGASTVEVDFSSGYKAHGTVLASDSDADVAVIKTDVPVEEIYPLTIGDSSTLQVGQSVVAIGNPFGLSGTMTLGIVSGLGRTQFAHAVPDSGNAFFSTADIIQTDAAINPGNSGGPLFNLNGEVVGINQSILTNNTTSSGEPANSGVGFSVSINLVKRIVPVLIQSGTYKYPYLGISSSSEMPLAVYEALGLTSYKGVYVREVTAGGPAEQAGLKGGSTPTSLTGWDAGGDVILAMDGKPVDTYDQLLSQLVTTKSPGDTVVLTVLRNGQTQDITVTLGERP